MLDEMEDNLYGGKMCLAYVDIPLEKFLVIFAELQGPISILHKIVFKQNKLHPNTSDTKKLKIHYIPFITSRLELKDKLRK